MCLLPSSQQSFYPLYPPAEELSVDLQRWSLHCHLPAPPHLLILPSDLRHFIKVFLFFFLPYLSQFHLVSFCLVLSVSPRSTESSTSHSFSLAFLLHTFFLVQVFLRVLHWMSRVFSLFFFTGFAECARLRRAEPGAAGQGRLGGHLRPVADPPAIRGSGTARNPRRSRPHLNRARKGPPSSTHRSAPRSRFRSSLNTPRNGITSATIEWHHE